MQTNTLHITFPNIRLRNKEAAELRRMVNNALGWTDDLLHNHSADKKEIYRYPMVQFRTKNDIPSLFGVASGVATLKQLLMEDKLPTEFRHSYTLKEEKHLLQMGDDHNTYHIAKYLPLSTENYARWKSEKSLVGKLFLVENLLKSHLLEFCENVGFDLNHDQLVVYLKQLDKLPAAKLEGSGNNMNFLCFDTIFETNLSLPVGIGLGKGKSKGFGEIAFMNQKQKT